MWLKQMAHLFLFDLQIALVVGVGEDDDGQALGDGDVF